MHIFLLFFLIATPILGLLCLIVLEYQNSRARHWTRTWSLSTPIAPSLSDASPTASSGKPRERTSV